MNRVTTALKSDRRAQYSTVLALLTISYYLFISGSPTFVTNVLDFDDTARLLPLFNAEGEVNYDNFPHSVYRTNPDQFRLDSRKGITGTPFLMIITATSGAQPSLSRTAESLRHQSFTHWEWIVVNDRSSEGISTAERKELKEDPRVTVLASFDSPTLSAARNVGLEYALALKNVPRYLMYIDENDLLESTALEKMIWMLESNQEWAIGASYFNRFGGANETVTKGLHNGRQNYDEENYIPNSAIFRSDALQQSDCRFSETNLLGNAGSWDFWMCLAEAGFWGGTIPEVLSWHQVTAQETLIANSSLGVAVRSQVQERHPSLSALDSFPVQPARWSDQLEPVIWNTPYTSSLDTSTRSIMFVIPWLYTGGADYGALHMIELFTRAGYRVTVVCTLYLNPQGLDLVPFVSQWTRDLHILPAFLRANDLPRYIKHLIESRGTKEVLISNVQLMYELLPVLTELLPNVKFSDYIHNEAYDGWKSGGYPIYSIISQRYLSRTITASWWLRNWAIERGHDPDRIGVARMGVALERFVPVTEEARNLAKRKMLGVGPEVTVIATTGRMDGQKRPLLIPAIANELRNRGVDNFIIVMMGGGDLLFPVRSLVKLLKVGKYVKTLGSVKRPQEYLAAADIFLLPSVTEGLCIAAAEAMAMRIPVVLSRAGALPELLGETVIPLVGPLAASTVFPDILPASAKLRPIAGVLVNQTMNDTTDPALYATELQTLIGDAELRKELGLAGEAIIQTTDWRVTLGRLFRELEIGRVAAPSKESEHSPIAQFALQNLLSEQKDGTDFASSQSTAQIPILFGNVAKLSTACAAKNGAALDWLQAVGSGVDCRGKPIPQIASLIRSASLQCDTWCIFDLTTRKRAGWHFQGNGDKCLSPILDSSLCREAWSSRPRILLTNGELSDESTSL